eukprot:COSAG06_NODE_1236_length_10137_cov_3.357342_1_plen_115_part_00
MLRPIRLSPAVLQSTQRQQPAPLPEHDRDHIVESAESRREVLCASRSATLRTTPIEPDAGQLPRLHIRSTRAVFHELSRDRRPQRRHDRTQRSIDHEDARGGAGREARAQLKEA